MPEANDFCVIDIIVKNIDTKAYNSSLYPSTLGVPIDLRFKRYGGVFHD